jgi:hypothetical protein
MNHRTKQHNLAVNFINMDSTFHAIFAIIFQIKKTMAE